MTGYISGIDTSSASIVAPIVVVAVLGVSLLARSRRPAASRSVAADWPHTSGTVLSATVQVSQKGAVRQATPLVLYAYQVGGEVFQGNRVCVRGAADASGALARYPAGACVTVYYDPANPANSALER
ncbi:MAG: DUF3592 domain-containing protein [Actinomycetota bacterium]|nr:DUF3592 domain-containing protein [Actinomycetota bacterium]